MMILILGAPFDLLRPDTAGEWSKTINQQLSPYLPSWLITFINAKKLYYEFSKMLGLNMQMRHYLIKYLLICIHI